jgi:hypothetical protein
MPDSVPRQKISLNQVPHIVTKMLALSERLRSSAAGKTMVQIGADPVPIRILSKTLRERSCLAPNADAPAPYRRWGIAYKINGKVCGCDGRREANQVHTSVNKERSLDADRAFLSPGPDHCRRHHQFTMCPACRPPDCSGGRRLEGRRQAGSCGEFNGESVKAPELAHLRGFLYRNSRASWVTGLILRSSHKGEAQ